MYSAVRTTVKGVKVLRFVARRSVGVGWGAGGWGGLVCFFFVWFGVGRFGFGLVLIGYLIACGCGRVCFSVVWFGVGLVSIGVVYRSGLWVGESHDAT